MVIKQLEAFVSAAESRSFSEAARQRFLTQPTISSHIKALEQELDCTLFIRNKRSVTLTKSGELLYPYARRMLDLKEEAMRKLKAPDRQTVCIGASTIPSGYLLPGLLSGFRKKEPEVFFTIRQSDSDQVETMVLDGLVDFGMIGKKSESPDVECIPFCTDTLVLAMPAARHYLKKLEADPGDIFLSEPVILREEGSGTLKAMSSWLEEHQLDVSSLNVVARNNDLESIKRMIEDGLGVSIMSGLSVKDLADSGRILTVPLPSSKSRQFYILRKKDRVLSDSIQSFLKYVTGELMQKK